MAEFKVIIEGLELDPKATKAINDAIQRAVLDHLAGLDLTTGRNQRAVIGFRPRPDWYGIIAQIVSQKDLVRQIPAIEETIGRIDR